MSGKANSLGPLLVDQIGDMVQVTFVQDGCRLKGCGKTLEEARLTLEGRVAVFRALHAFVKAELKYRVVAREDLVDFVQRCVKLHLRQRYPMIKLHQVRNEMKAMARLEGHKLAVKYDKIVSKIFQLSSRDRASG
jgi:hypothetical protein